MIVNVKMIDLYGAVVQSIRVKANLQILIYMCAKAHREVKKWNHK